LTLVHFSNLNPAFVLNAAINSRKTGAEEQDVIILRGWRL
jgi:hypothetical protein